MAASRFAEAVQRLQPWAAEAAGDAAFAAALQQAQAGVARLEAERREQDALARQLDSAKELIVRQDFAGAGKVVQAILAAHPNHPAAKNLEKEIARGVEFRAKAAAAVERARALFDAKPGEAMELLERFTPAHGLVDGALADMRERHAARERERLRREQQARRQQQIDAFTGKAGELARNRAVQGGVAAVLLLVVVIASWSSIFPPQAGRSGRPGSRPPTSTPATSRRPPRRRRRTVAPPPATATVDPGQGAPRRSTRRRPPPVDPGTAAHADRRPRSARRGPGRHESGRPRPRRGPARAPPTPNPTTGPAERRQPSGAIVGAAGRDPDAAGSDAARQHPRPEPPPGHRRADPPRDTAKVTVPAAGHRSGRGRRAGDRSVDAGLSARPTRRSTPAGSRR